MHDMSYITFIEYFFAFKDFYLLSIIALIMLKEDRIDDMESYIEVSCKARDAMSYFWII